MGGEKAHQRNKRKITILFLPVQLTDRERDSLSSACYYICYTSFCEKYQEISLHDSNVQFLF